VADAAEPEARVGEHLRLLVGDPDRQRVRGSCDGQQGDDAGEQQDETAGHGVRSSVSA
jgi:hypothetical protein